MNKHKLILGTAQLGLDYGINNQKGKPSEKEAFNILNAASENRIQYLDTAAAYGDSEEIIGNYHRAVGESVFKVITKFHASKQSPAEVVGSALERLSVDKIDTLLFHSFNDYEKLRETASYDELRGQVGKSIINLGVSVYTNEELDALCEDSAVSVVQLPFNLLDNEWIRGETLRKLKAKNISVHTRSVFLQGLFFKEIAKLRTTLEPLKSHLETIRRMVDGKDLPIGALALQYVLSKSYIDGVLFGVESIDQLVTNMEWLSLNIDSEILKQIDLIQVKEKELLNPSNW